MKYKFGSVIAEIAGNEIITNKFHDEFKNLRIEDGVSSCIFEIHLDDPYKFGDQDLLSSTSQFVLSIDDSGDTIKVDAFPSFSQRMKFGAYFPTQIQKILTAKFEDIHEKIYLYFFYQVFYSFLQLSLLKKSESLFHSSAIEIRKGRAILIAGHGGVGKSSTASILCKSLPGAKFLSDDQCIINSDGFVYGNPFSIHVYPYNIKDVMANKLIWENVFDKMQWKARKSILGPKRVCRRVDPSKIFDTVNDWKNKKKIDTIYVFKKASIDSPNVKNMDEIEFSEFMNSVMEEELPNLFQVIKKIDNKKNIYSNNEINFKQKEIYKKVGEKIDIIEISIPIKYDLKKISEYIIDDQL